MDRKKAISFYYWLAIPAFIIFIWLAIAIVNKSDLGMDDFFRTLLIKDSEQYNNFFKLATKLGSSSFIIIATLLVGIVLAFKRNWKGFFVTAVAVVGSDQINKLVKQLTSRDRPLIDPLIDAEGFGFPSGHAMISVIFYGMVLFLILKSVKHKRTQKGLFIAYIILCLVIGMSRIALQAHYPSDVLAGYLLGYCYIIFCLLLYDKIIPFLANILKKEPTYDKKI